MPSRSVQARRESSPSSPQLVPLEGSFDEGATLDSATERLLESLVLTEEPDEFARRVRQKPGE
ncbi:MAG: hypothetical protein D6718_10665 [Acidobacteria bacterium]|nr:MAG: hypothetical protein D6718_10665 [Acidobacteriota bacterium]